MTISLRAAIPDDIETIASVWHRGWEDGHLGHVPDALLPHRGLVHFRERVPPRIPTTTVATVASTVVGFVTVHDDEVEQIYVAENARDGAEIRGGEVPVPCRRYEKRVTRDPD